MNSNKRIASTVYSLGKLFFFSGIYVQIPCIKEIMMMMMMMIIIIIITESANIKAEKSQRRN
jgi:hypothetical protein